MAETLVGAAHATRSSEQAFFGTSTVETRQCVVSTTSNRIPVSPSFPVQSPKTPFTKRLPSCLGGAGGGQLFQPFHRAPRGRECSELNYGKGRLVKLRHKEPLQQKQTKHPNTYYSPHGYFRKRLATTHLQPQRQSPFVCLAGAVQHVRDGGR